MIDYGRQIIQCIKKKILAWQRTPSKKCPGLHICMAKEADTTAVDTHVDREVDGQCHLLDHRALVLRREDLATNTNERFLLEGVTTDGMLLSMPSLISTVDAEYIDRLSPRVLDSRGIGER
jgi:hypothetical protein